MKLDFDLDLDLENASFSLCPLARRVRRTLSVVGFRLQQSYTQSCSQFRVPSFNKPCTSMSKHRVRVVE